jgi:predicted ATPase
MKKDKKLKEEIVDKCWYKICYADGLKEKDKWKYAEAMGEEILALFEEEKKKWAEEIEKWIKESELQKPSSSVVSILWRKLQKFKRSN